MRKFLTKASKIIPIICLVFTLVAANSIWAFDGINTSIRKPSFTIIDSLPYRVYAEKQSTWKVNIKNDSRFSASSVVVRVDTAKSQLEGVRYIGNSLKPISQRHNAQTTKEYSIDIIADASVKEGIYPIYLQLDFKDNGGNSHSQELIAYYEVRKDIKELESISVKNTNFDTVNIVKDDIFSLKYEIANLENYSINNVKTYIEGLTSEYITLASSIDSYEFDKIKPAMEGDVELKYHIKRTAPSGNYPFKVVYEYDNKNGQRIVRRVDFNLYVPFEDAKEGQLKYSNVVYPKAIAEDKTFSVSFDVTNTGQSDVEEILIQMNDNPVFLPKSPSIVKWDKLAAGESKKYSLTAVASGDNLTDRNYPISFNINYGKGENKSVDNQIYGIYVDADEKDDKDDKKQIPKIILSQYKIEPTIVQAGEDFTLDMRFLNTNSSKTIYNIKAFLTFEVADAKNSVNQNVFSPIESSNTFFISEIGPRQEVRKTLKMYTIPNAIAKTYTVTVNFEYEDKNGNQITASELVGVPVTQITKIETSELTYMPNASVGEEFNLTFNIFNSGKSQVSNLLIKTEGDFNADPNNRYIGNFDVGSSQTYDGYISMNQPGKQTGKFIISYDTQSGEHVEMVKEFTVDVEEPFVPEPNMGEAGMGPDSPDNNNMGMMPPKVGNSKIFIIGIPLVLVIIIVAIIIIQKRRKAKKEKEFYENK